MQFLVTEVQDLGNGTIANQVFSFDSEVDAESKYYEILSYAAKSKIPSHGAIMYDSLCHYMYGKSYRREETGTVFIGDGNTTVFVLNDSPIELISVKINGSDVPAEGYSLTGKTITFTTAPEKDAEIIVMYTRNARN